MSGGEGLRALGCFPPPAATVADAREACLFAGSGGRGGGGGGDTARSAARAFPLGVCGGGTSHGALGQQVFLWIAALD